MRATKKSSSSSTVSENHVCALEYLPLLSQVFSFYHQRKVHLQIESLIQHNYEFHGNGHYISDTKKNNILGSKNILNTKC